MTRPMKTILSTMHITDVCGTSIFQSSTSSMGIYHSVLTMCSQHKVSTSARAFLSTGMMAQSIPKITVQLQVFYIEDRATS
jgi:hypothetical protein